MAELNLVWWEKNRPESLKSQKSLDKCIKSVDDAIKDVMRGKVPPTLFTIYRPFATNLPRPKGLERT